MTQAYLLFTMSMITAWLCHTELKLFQIQITSPQDQKDGGDRRDRTDDLKLAKLALSQLSYVPDHDRRGSSIISMGRALVVGLGRFELPTSRLSSARSNQLSYRPVRAAYVI